jgi:hypothetical protein
MDSSHGNIREPNPIKFIHNPPQKRGLQEFIKAGAELYVPASVQ